VASQTTGTTVTGHKLTKITQSTEHVTLIVNRKQRDYWKD